MTDHLELLHALASQRQLVRVTSEEVIKGELYRMTLWVDPCTFCGEQIRRRIVRKLERGVPARIRMVEGKLSRLCSGCKRDAWSLDGVAPAA